ncbi:MAG: aldolase [Ruminococcus sp.]|nr:aldolase [Ruminococcus sp.]
MELRKNIKQSLKRLKDGFGVVSIKAEFEAEGSRKDELIMLREFVENAELGLIIKIGGCEAVHDIDQCKLLGATGVMAPMIETPFAMKKYKGAVAKIYGDDPEIEKIINAETITCLKNFDEILKCGKGFITGVTVGRSDLSASMGIAKKDIECDEVLNATKEFCVKAKGNGLITNFGGNIGVESIPFIIEMAPFIDRFETRKVVIRKSDDAAFLKEAIVAALEFELLYLRFKSEYYSNMANEDALRIKRLESQIGAI